MSLDRRSTNQSPVRQRSTRDRPAKAPLSVGAIVDAALAILQSEGLEAVTMRRVAAALDTGAASLYVYVSSREGLQLAMLDRVATGWKYPDPFTMARPVARTPHADAPSARRSSRYCGDDLGLSAHDRGGTALTENLLGIAGGIDPERRLGLQLLVLLVTGVASEDDVRRARGNNTDDSRGERNR